MTPAMRSPSSQPNHSSPQTTYSGSNGVPSSPSIPSYHSSSTSSPSIPPLQRTGSQSGMQPRLGSRGAAAVAAAGGGGTGGERNILDAVTDGEIQAKVHNIMLGQYPFLFRYSMQIFSNFGSTFLNVVVLE